MVYERKRRGETVFFQGDVPERFYIILSGSVNVMIAKDHNTLHSELVAENEKLIGLSEKESSKRLYHQLQKLYSKREECAETDFERMQKDHDAWNDCTK